MRWVRFSNGKVWSVYNNGWIKGSVVVPRYRHYANLDARLAAIVEEIVGSDVGVPNIAYRHHGNNVVAFCIDVSGMMDGNRKGVSELGRDTPELRNALKKQYPINDSEAEHLLTHLGKEYGQESVLNVRGSRRQVRCPKDPKRCNYVRIVVDDLEIGFWRDSQWSHTPAEVMGAILDAARDRQHQHSS